MWLRKWSANNISKHMEGQRFLVCSNLFICATLAYICGALVFIWHIPLFFLGGVFIFMRCLFSLYTRDPLLIYQEIFLKRITPRVPLVEQEQLTRSTWYRVIAWIVDGKSTETNPMWINSSWRSYRIGGVMISVLVPSAVDSEFEHNLLILRSIKE